MLERLDAVIGALRDTAERVAPGRAVLAIVSDHGFARTDAQLNLFPAFRDAGLFSDDGKGRITEWKAMPWTAGGSVAVVLKDPSDAATRAEVRNCSAALAIEPGNGIDRVLEADVLRPARQLPTASFLVGLEPGMADGLERLTGPVRSRSSRAARTAFLSNGVPETMARIRAERPLDRWFDVVVVSYEVGLAKPDPRIFELCLSRLGAHAGEALFVDDRAENVAAAERLGMRTLHFTGDDATPRLLDAVRSRIA